MAVKYLGKLGWLIIAAVVFIPFTACKKDDAPLTSEFPLPPLLKSMFYFKPGSYWIYADVHGEHLDSVYVVSSVRDTIYIYHPGSQELIATKERITTRTASLFFGAHYVYESDTDERQLWLNPNSSAYRIKRTKFAGTQNLGSTYVTYYPFVANQRNEAYVGSGLSYSCVTVGQKTNLPIIDSIIPLAYHVQVDRDRTEQHNLYNLYFVENVGLVRFDSPTNPQDWRLVRYNVVQ